MGKNSRICLTAVAAAVLFASTALALEPGTMRAHFIDIGQGDATLLEFSCGVALIDTGGERWPADELQPARYDSNPVLFQYLDDFFRSRPDLERRIDVLFLTHPHADHTRGAAIVVDEFEPRSVVHNGQSFGSGIAGQNYARDYAGRNAPDVRAWYVLADKVGENGLVNPAIDPLPCPDVDPELRVLWGQVRDDSGWEASDFRDGNNHSVVIRVDFGEASLLFPGDLEERYGQPGRAGIERLVEKFASTSLLDVDILHVGHHGSHNGNTPALTAAVSPRVAVFSSGPACPRPDFSAWSHAHPRKETLDEVLPHVSDRRSATVKIPFFARHEAVPELLTTQKAIYGTGWDGNVILEISSDGSWSEASVQGRPRCLEEIDGP
jgi:competence protein ComEC